MERRSPPSFWTRHRRSGSRSPAGNALSGPSLGAVVTEFGTIRVKIRERDGRVIAASPEYEDYKQATAQHGVLVRHVNESAVVLYKNGKL
jgi:uncharacterized protein (DUF111 family)